MARFLRYPGGKGRKSVREKILEKFPTDYDYFIEPMVGGGLFWYVNCSNIIISDIDDNLMSVYYALKNRSKQFIQKVREIDPYLKTDKDKERIKKIFENFKNPKISCDKALRYLFINRTVFAGRVRYDIPSRLFMSNPEGWNKSLIKNLQTAARSLQNVDIKTVPYNQLINIKKEKCLIYLDPPYYLNSLLAETSKLYRHNFTIEDHKQLAKDLEQCKNYWVLSYDDCPEIRKLYANFNICETSWKYSGTSSCDGHNKNKKNGKELIITNY